MTDTPYDAAMTRSKQELARQVVDCNARIEALEAALQFAVEVLESYSASRGYDPSKATPFSAIGVARAALDKDASR